MNVKSIHLLQISACFKGICWPKFFWGTTSCLVRSLGCTKSYVVALGSTCRPSSSEPPSVKSVVFGCTYHPIATALSYRNAVQPVGKSIPADTESSKQPSKKGAVGTKLATQKVIPRLFATFEPCSLACPVTLFWERVPLLNSKKG